MEVSRACSLQIKGDPCVLVHDDNMSKLLNTDLLITWQEQDGVKIRIDRYDIRNFFEYERCAEWIGDIHGSVCEGELLDEEELICEEERYRDLTNQECHWSEDCKGSLESIGDNTEHISRIRDEPDKCHPKAPSSLIDSSSCSSGSAQWSHETRSTPKSESSRPQQSQARDASPESITINGVLAPKCNRLRTILLKTAMFVRNSTNPQVEVLIRVNQQDNVDLSFIHHSNKFHRYYKAVRDGEVTLDENDVKLLEKEKGKVHRDIATQPVSESGSREAAHESQDQVIYSNCYTEPAQVIYSGYPAYYTWNPYMCLNVLASNPQDLLSKKMEGVIEKVANFVVKNGIQFEQKVLKHQKNNPDFEFLNPQSELHAYYQSVLGRIRSEEKHAVQDFCEPVARLNKRRALSISVDDALKQKKVVSPQSPSDNGSQAESPLHDSPE